MGATQDEGGVATLLSLNFLIFPSFSLSDTSIPFSYFDLVLCITGSRKGAGR